MILKITYQKDSQRFIPVQEGVTLGHSKSDVIIKDPLLSSPHIKVEKMKNIYLLRDLNSKEGLVLNAKKVQFLILEQGVKCQIGSTTIEVVSNDDVTSSIEKIKHKEEVSEIGDNKTSFAKDIKLLKAEGAQLKNKLSKIHFLKNPIKVSFEQGVQKGQSWKISYLPRKIGSMDADLPLIDPTLDKVSFGLILQKEEPFLQLEEEEKFLVNYKKPRRKKIKLKNKDLIIVGTSYMRFEFK